MQVGDMGAEGLAIVMETGPLLGGWFDPGLGWSSPGPNRSIQGLAVLSAVRIRDPAFTVPSFRMG